MRAPCKSGLRITKKGLRIRGIRISGGSRIKGLWIRGLRSREEMRLPRKSGLRITKKGLRIRQAKMG